MITLQRLLELRTDDALVEHLKRVCEHATSLVAIDIVAISASIANGGATPSTIADSNDGALAMMLAIHEESRQPFVEFLKELDRSAVVRVRPHLHAELKDLLR